MEWNWTWIVNARVLPLDNPQVFFWVVNLKDPPVGFSPFPVQRCRAGRAGGQLGSLTAGKETSLLRHTKLHLTVVCRKTQWHQTSSHTRTLTFGFALGFSCSNFLAAASMDAAAPSNSVSAMTVGSSGSTHSVPKISPKRVILGSCDHRALALLQTVSGLACREAP